MAEKKTFMVVVTSDNVRDVQIADTSNLGHMEDGWTDMTECEVVLGKVKTNNAEEAKLAMAELAKVSVDVLAAYELATGVC